MCAAAPQTYGGSTNQTNGAIDMQQSDLDLTMLSNLLRDGRATADTGHPQRNEGPGFAERIRTLIAGARRPVGRRVGQAGASSSR
jgi:hypothetical protein